jgi:hypothetical protein
VDRDAEQGDGSVYEDVIQNGDEMASIDGHFLDVEKSSIPKAQAQTSDRLPSTIAEAHHDSEVQGDDVDLTKQFMVKIHAGKDRDRILIIRSDPACCVLAITSSPFQEPPRVTKYDGEQEQFPHGPRNLDEEGRASPMTSSRPLTVTATRRSRSVTVTDRKVRSADVGVSGIYEVISEADLAFSPDAHTEAVTVFQGRIREEVVYGICLPMPGFSALFIVVALSAVISALVAGAMLHRLQAQREMAAVTGSGKVNRGGVHAAAAANNNNNNNSWLSYGLLRVRCAPRPVHHAEQLQKQATSGSPEQLADPSVERG